LPGVFWVILLVILLVSGVLEGAATGSLSFCFSFSSFFCFVQFKKVKASREEEKEKERRKRKKKRRKRKKKKTLVASEILTALLVSLCGILVGVEGTAWEAALLAEGRALAELKGVAEGPVLAKLEGVAGVDLMVLLVEDLAALKGRAVFEEDEGVALDEGLGMREGVALEALERDVGGLEEEEEEEKEGVLGVFGVDKVLAAAAALRRVGLEEVFGVEKVLLVVLRRVGFVVDEGVEGSAFWSGLEESLEDTLGVVFEGVRVVVSLLGPLTSFISGGGVDKGEERGGESAGWV